jgi:hypothetical protein
MVSMLLIGSVTLAMATFAPNLCPVPAVYLGTGRSNALLVDVQSRQATYTRRAVELENLVAAMRESKSQHNIAICSKSGQPCVDIKLPEGRIVLAVRVGPVGSSYEAEGVAFQIVASAPRLGFGLGDMYWISYKSDDKNNPAGVFAFSSTQGITAISMTEDPDARTSALGSTLILLNSPGLLADCPVGQEGRK